MKLYQVNVIKNWIPAYFFLHTSMRMLSIYNRPQCGLLMRSIHNYTKLCPLPADPSAVSIVHYEVFLDTHRLADWNSGVRVTRSLVLYVCFVDRCFSFCTFSFGHCVVCPSIYRFWLPLWYLQTLLEIRFLRSRVFYVCEYLETEHTNHLNVSA